MTIALLIIVAFGLVLNIVLRLGLGRALQYRPETHYLPPISVLKPLCGNDPSLEDNLRTFFELDYPKYQLVFGVEKESDAAVPVVRRLIEEYPTIDTHLVIDDGTVGHNAKVNNLANIAQTLQVRGLRHQR